ncbi:GIY-YIG nuclease family protein [Microtetraspora malaysiensis]|uniref:GIY-YIG nuclease family protein n=1 Tax=Microtetraspora malaysiensis TaxID=161358 RepID=UPI003D934C11
MIPQHKIGFVYVLTNEAMPGLVKVGLSSWLPEDRALDLYKTGLPKPFEVAFRTMTSRPEAVERRAHELLAETRVNPRREFFNATVAQAIDAVRMAAVEVAGIESWQSLDRYLLRSGDRLALALEEGQVFALISWTSLQKLFAGHPPEIIDLWQAQSDGDHLEIFGARSPGHVAGFSDNHPGSDVDPVPYLDRDQMAANGMLIGREMLAPGDRLLWVAGPRSDQHFSVLFEADDYCQVINRTWSPQMTEYGIARLLNDFTHNKPWPEMENAVHDTLALSPPRSWAPREDRDSDDWALIGDEPQPPAYWLPQLQPRKRQKRTR